MAEAAETRRYKRMMKQLEAEKAFKAWAAVQGDGALQIEAN